MDYEKKYKEEIDRATQLWECGDITRENLEYLFPELKESEDEKIRKAIIEFFESQDDNTTYSLVQKKDILAWFEKQGESDETKAKIFLMNKGYPIDTNGIFPTYEEMYNIIRDGLEKQGESRLVNFDEAEKEKYDFVSGQYIECRASFNEFKKDNSYWLEYIGNDTYIGRSDNILNQKFHITPKQLYCLFTQEHCPKENNVNEETNAPTGYGKYVDECLNEASKHFLSEGEDKYSVADLFYAGVRCGKSWFEKQDKQKFSTEAKPKFKVGDWITNGQLICKVLSVMSKSYELHLYNDDYCHFETDVQSVDKDYHLWTIQDAKNGDVFAYVTDEDELWIMIFMSLYEPYEGHVHYHALLVNDKFFDKGTCCICINDLKPATKEQRNILFEKMHEAGYEWDAKNKELKKIEQQ